MPPPPLLQIPKSIPKPPFFSHRTLADSFAAYSRLRHRRPSAPILHPLSSLLARCTSLATVHGIQLHTHVVTLGFTQCPYISARLVAFYASINQLNNSRIAAEGCGAAPTLPWNALITAYVFKGYWWDAISVYTSMVDVDRFTYPSVLTACGQVNDLFLGREIHREIVNSGVEMDLYVGNALVAMYVKCGDFEAAREMFDGMPERDVVTFNSMISGYVARGMWGEAFGLLGLFPEGAEVNVVTWNTIIGGYMGMGDYVEVLRLVSRMRGCGTGVDSVTLVIGLKACSMVRGVRQGMEIHGLAVRMEWDGLEYVRNTLITMYARCGRISNAYVLFRDCARKSLVTWNALIAGFARADRVDEVTWMFQEMVRSGMQPNYVTVVTMLSLCARCTKVRYGQQLHWFVSIHGLEDCLLLSNALVDMYSKSGWMSAAQRVFDMMSSHDVVSYTSMILGYGMQGKGHTSLKLFDEMLGRGFVQDHITLMAVLSACSHSQLVTEGQSIFEKMVGLYGIIPRVEHYSCMIDLYGRVGLLRKAEEMLHWMPIPPSTAMLATLVGACLMHRNPEIGKRSADNLLERLQITGSRDPGHYCLVARMFAYCIRDHLGLHPLSEARYWQAR